MEVHVQDVRTRGHVARELDVELLVAQVDEIAERQPQSPPGVCSKAVDAGAVRSGLSKRLDVPSEQLLSVLDLVGDVLVLGVVEQELELGHVRQHLGLDVVAVLVVFFALPLDRARHRVAHRRHLGADVGKVGGDGLLDV